MTERSIDLIARELGARARRGAPAQHDRGPTRCPIAWAFPIATASRSSTTAATIPARLQKALDALGGVEAFRGRQREARAAGPLSRTRHRLLYRGHRRRAVRRRDGPHRPGTGKIYVASGACPQGQGMETIFAQIVADAWSGRARRRASSRSPTAPAIAMGFGTIASRSTVTVSAAIHYASDQLRDKVFAIAANMLECAAARSRAAQRRRRHRRRAGRAGVARRARAGRAPRLGPSAGREASTPAWRKPTTSSRRRSPGLTRRTRRSSRSMSRPAG